MAESSEIEGAEHDRGAEHAFDRTGFAGVEGGVGIGWSWQRPDLRRGRAVVHEKRTNGADFLMIFEIVGQFRDAVARDDGVVMQEQDVRTVGGANPDVQCFGKTEIFRQPDEANRGKLLIERPCAVFRTVVHNENLVGVPQRLKAVSQLLAPVVRDDDDGDAACLLLEFLFFGSQVVILLGGAGLAGYVARFEWLMMRLVPNAQLIAISITVLAVLVGTIFNNTRIGDMNNRLDDLKEVLRAEMKAQTAQLDLRFSSMDRKLDEILRIAR